MSLDDRVASKPIEINVPLVCNHDDNMVGSAVSYFTVTPSSEHKDWKTVLVCTNGSTMTADSIDYQFTSPKDASENTLQLEPYQKAIFIADLASDNVTQLWQFYGDGVVFMDTINNEECNVRTEIQNQGTRLVITIDKVSTKLKSCELEFRYMASCIDNASEAAGEMKVYYSQDPRIGVGRARI
jgi:hypothetical protein